MIDDEKKSKEQLITEIRQLCVEKEKLEKTLVDNEGQFQTMVSNFPGAVYRCANDENWTMHYISDGIEEISGYKADDFIENKVKKYDSIILPEDKQMVRDTVQDALNENCHYTIEFRMIDKNGDIHWVYEKGRGVYNKDGKLLFLDGAIFDITHKKLVNAEVEKQTVELLETNKRLNEEVEERQRAEESLMKSEERFRTVFEQAPISMELYNVNGFQIQINEAWRGLWGIDPLLTIGIYNVLSDEQIKNDAKLFDAIKKAFNGERASISDYEYDPQKSGYPGRKRYLSTYIYPIIQQGEVQNVVVTHDDITERVLAEKNVRENEQRYRALFDFASDAIFIMGNKVFEECNERTLEIFACKREQIIGESPARFSPPLQPNGRDSVEMVKKNIEVALSGKHHFFEWLHCRYDGTPFDAEVSLSLVVINGEKKLVAIVRDISRRKNAEREKEKLEVQLRQSQKMEAIGTLAGGIAHDFNNILTAIIGYTELSIMESAEDSELYDNLKQIEIASNRARDLVQQILTFSRKSKQKNAPIDIAPIIKETLKLIRSSLPTTIEIKQNIVLKSSTVLADPTQIHQIIVNICTNAGYAMREKGGLLQVSLTEKYLDEIDIIRYKGLKEGNYLHLQIGDNGCAMDNDTLAQVFNPFFTTKPGGEGTGMGLAVVHGIVKSHKGFINVYSEKNIGTTFNILLPKYIGDSETIAISTAKVPTGTETILLVDDEIIIVEMAKKMLAGLGYTVIAMDSSVKALELFKTNPNKFDLVVSDQTMPNLTGINMAKAMLDIRQDMPIIICSGYTSAVAASRAQSIGVKLFMMKPYMRRDLAINVRKALDD